MSLYEEVRELLGASEEAKRICDNIKTRICGGTKYEKNILCIYYNANILEYDFKEIVDTLKESIISVDKRHKIIHYKNGYNVCLRTVEECGEYNKIAGYYFYSIRFC